MSNQSNYKDDFVDNDFEILFDHPNKIRKWNEGLLIKSLITFPIIIFIIGILFVNRPETLIGIVFSLLYPLALISIGVMILFLMRSYLK